MMDIRKRRNLLFVISIFISAVISGQERENLMKLIATTETIVDNKLSENGDWSTWRKSYDGNADTLMIKSNHFTEQKIRTKVLSYRFLVGNTILINYKDKVEWIDLKKDKNLIVQNISKTFPIDSGKYFGITQKTPNKDLLQIYNSENGQFITEEKIDRYFYYAKEQKLIIVQKENKTNTIKFWDDNHFESLKSTTDDVITAILSSDNQSWALIGKAENQELYAQLIARKNLKIWDIKSPLKEETEFILPKDLGDGKWLFEFLGKMKERGNGIVEVWYSQERDLETLKRPSSKIIRVLADVNNGSQKNLSKFGFSDIFPISGNRALAYNRTELEDYIAYRSPVKLHLINLTSDKMYFIDTVDHVLLNENVNILLTKSKDFWTILDLASLKKTKINHQNLSTPIFSDNSTILFATDSAICKYDIRNQKGKNLISDNEATFKMLSKNSKMFGSGKIWMETSENYLRNEVFFEIKKNDQSQVSLWKFSGKKPMKILQIEGNKYSSLKSDKEQSAFQWVEENHNLSPMLKLRSKKKDDLVIFSSNSKKESLKALKKEVITYQNSRGKKLNGILYYPMNFSEQKEYPLVVKIYEDQLKFRNDFTAPSLKNDAGFNIMNLLVEGYFVLLPDIEYDDRGPGLCAVDAIHAALDKIGNNESIDSSNIALYGFSFGGYETNFIATQSNRFKIYISGSGMSDTVSDYFLYNNNFKNLNYYRFENYQMRHHKSFTENKEKFFNNNPIYFTENVNAPMLLFTGKKDQNIPWDNSLKMYSALRRNNKKVAVLFYKNEAHGLYQTKAQLDLSLRVLDWLDYFLKGKQVEWIDKEMKDAN